MSETDAGTSTAGTPPADAPDGGTTPQSGSAADESADRELPQAVRDVLAKERRAAKEAERRAKAAEARVREFEDASKSETERLAERATAAESAAEAATLQAARFRAAISAVGLSKHVIERITLLSERLQGDDEAALARDAERLAKLLTPPEPKAGTSSAGAWSGGSPAPRGQDDPRAAVGRALLDQVRQARGGTGR